jgi:hypothetical protein
MITEAIIYLERETHLEDDAERRNVPVCLFSKLPKCRKSGIPALTRPAKREALFFEKMYVMEVGLQMFDSLFAAFLSARLGQGWGEELQKIEAWLVEQ